MRVVFDLVAPELLATVVIWILGLGLLVARRLHAKIGCRDPSPERLVSRPRDEAVSPRSPPQYLDEWNLGERDTRILAWLLIRGESYGAEIARELGIPRTTVYTRLSRLVHAGFVDSTLSVGAKPEGRRRYYKVTGSGASALHARLAILDAAKRHWRVDVS